MVGDFCRNNIGMHNVHVQPAAGGDAETAFYVVGSGERDSLVVRPSCSAASSRSTFRLLRCHGARLACSRSSTVHERRLAYARAILSATRHDAPRESGRLRTEVAGAAAAEVVRGVATLTVAPGEQMVMPHVRIVDGARMPVRLRVRGARIDGRRRFVHVAQLSGGQLMGGVTLELRRGLRRRRQ